MCPLLLRKTPGISAKRPLQPHLSGMSKSPIGHMGFMESGNGHSIPLAETAAKARAIGQ